MSTSCTSWSELGLRLGRRLAVEDGIDQVVEQLAQLGRLDLVGERLGLGPELLDQLLGLGEDAGAASNSSRTRSTRRLRRRRRRPCGRCDQVQQLLAVGRRSSLPGPGPAAASAGPTRTSWPATQLVVARRRSQSLRSLRIWKATPRLRLNSATIFSYGVGRPGQPHAGVEGRLERRGRLQGVDLQRVERRQRLVGGVAPEQLGPLPFGQLQVRVGQPVEDVGRARRRPAPCGRG